MRRGDVGRGTGFVGWRAWQAAKGGSLVPERGCIWVEFGVSFDSGRLRGFMLQCEVAGDACKRVALYELPFQDVDMAGRM